MVVEKLQEMQQKLSENLDNSDILAQDALSLKLDYEKKLADIIRIRKKL